MWVGANQVIVTQSEKAATKNELLASPTRQVIAGIGIFFVFCLLILAGNALWAVMLQLLAVAASLILTCYLAYSLVDHHYLLALAGWLAILFVLLTVTILILRQPELVLLYVMIAMLAASTLGGLAGTAASILAGGLVVWLPQVTGMPAAPLLYVGLVSAVGIFAALPGWLTTGSLTALTAWSVSVSEQARLTLETARDQQLEFKQVQDDLIKANSELARLSDRLKVMHQVAEEARQAKTQFVANVSHELRTPLNMIIGFAEMISQTPQVYGERLPAALMSDIGAIERNAQHLAKLISDVLDLSQVEAGRMALSKDWTNIRDVIEAAINLVRSLYDLKGLRLDVELLADLPRIFCDGVRIQQVVVNLLSNAGRFTETGGVSVRCRQAGDELIISVADTGPGIALEDQQRLFQPFQQVDGSSRRKYGGSGLGLSISKQFVEMHGGKIDMESAVGAGTTFNIHLPLEAPAADAPFTGRESPARWINPADPFGYRLRTRPFKAPLPVVKPHFVLVEREHTLQHLFNRYVTGADIVVLPDVHTAIAEINRSPSQVVVVNAPPHEALLEELADLPFGTPAIACWVPGEEEAAKQLGVVRYLVKPVGRLALLAVIEELGADIHNILVVDDEPDELHLFVRMLAASPNHYHILQATNGRRALNMLRSRRPDIMVLDLVMPGMTGLKVLQEKGQDAAIRDIPVIVVTGQDPTGGFIGSTLSIVRGSQLSAQELLECIQSIADIFAPLQSGQKTEQD